jgi:hypothetical protein
MVSKKYVGIISLLTLGVLLSSKKIHDFLLLTMTGRLTLILFILGISYLNISMGLISVVMIILMISNYDGIYEGYSNISVVPIVPTLNNIPKEETIGREGFNMIDRESSILKGKNSNQIPVSLAMRNQDDLIEPTDITVFTNLFSAF